MGPRRSFYNMSNIEMDPSKVAISSGFHACQTDKEFVFRAERAPATCRFVVQAALPVFCLFLGFLAVYSTRHMLHIILRSSELNLFALSYNILCISGYRWLKMVNNH